MKNPLTKYNDTLSCIRKNKFENEYVFVTFGWCKIKGQHYLYAENDFNCIYFYTEQFSSLLIRKKLHHRRSLYFREKYDSYGGKILEFHHKKKKEGTELKTISDINYSWSNNFDKYFKRVILPKGTNILFSWWLFFCSFLFFLWHMANNKKVFL